MQHRGKYLWIVLLLAGFCLGPPLAARADICAICGQPIQGTIYLITDKVTGEKNAGLFRLRQIAPVFHLRSARQGSACQLPDGRYLCARDAKTAVVKADDAERICAQVKDDLDRLFSRFTVFPDNVDVTVIDRIDVDSMFNPEGNDFESPDLLGCIRPRRSTTRPDTK